MALLQIERSGFVLMNFSFMSREKINEGTFGLATYVSEFEDLQGSCVYPPIILLNSVRMITTVSLTSSHF